MDPAHHTEPIEVEVFNLHWRRALERIVRAKGLEYREYPNYIEIVTPKEEEAPPLEATLDTKEVNISAVFFEGERRILRELGVNWQAISTGKTKIEASLATVSPGDGQQLSIVASRPLSATLNVLALLKTFEARNWGEIIASPQITVISGQEGRIQVGQDIFVTTRDFAGNVIQQTFPTGIILTVEPKIISQEDVNFIYLKISAERSSAGISAVGTTINRTQAVTYTLLRDGEQTVIGGLYTNDESVVRRGIPILKDLPWWVFGLRFLAGYNQKVITKKELVIFLKAEIVPSIRERLKQALRKPGEQIEKKREEFRKFKEQVPGP
ncbi:MAG TPA: type II and III secretion system protein [Candidatus Latescibacteria bacterium]|nr:type II and III secretion system protein [Candidatus Latescibacterota bacterium]